MTNEKQTDVNETNVTVIDNTPNEIVESNSIVETDLLTVSLQNTLVETDLFKKVLSDIPKHVSRANALLTGYRDDPTTFLENVDDTEVETLVKDLKDVNAFTTNVTKTRTAIKKYMDDVRNNLLETLDTRLEDAQFNELTKIHADTRQLQKDIINDRLARRWEELRPTFDANVKRYPLLQKYAPIFTDFNYFKQLYPDLLSGAKTRKVREKDHTTVNERLYEWSIGLEILHQNKWELSEGDLLKIAKMYEKNPTVQFVENEAVNLKNQEINRLKAEEEAKRRREEMEQRRLEEEAKRQKEIAEMQEQARLARIAEDAAAEERAKQQQLELEQRAEEAKRKQAIEEANQRALMKNFEAFQSQHNHHFVEAYPIYTRYLYENENLHDIHKSDRTKAFAIFELMKMAEDQTSPLVMDTQLEPHRVMNLIRYISSLS